MSLPTILTRVYFSSVETGYFSSASILSKVLLFVTSTIISISYPIFLRYSKDIKKLIQVINYSTVGIVSFTVIFFAFTIAFAPTFTSYIYGSKFHLANTLLPPSIIYIGMYSIICLNAHYFLSARRPIAPFLTIAPTIVQYILISNFHQSIEGVVYMSIYSLLPIVIICPFLSHVKTPPKKATI